MDSPTCRLDAAIEQAIAAARRESLSVDDIGASLLAAAIDVYIRDGRSPEWIDAIVSGALAAYRAQARS